MLVRLLLDTVAFIWMAEDDPALSELARERIMDPANELYLSSASSWEIAIKYSIGRLELKIPPEQYVPGQRRKHRVETMPISELDTLEVGHLPDFHRDPFYRLIVAQAIAQDLTILTNDSLIRRYPVSVDW